MPELPEVEAARKLAQEHCAGRKITRVVCEDDETVIQDVKPAELARELEGRTVKAVRRKGKSLWFEMTDDGPWPSFHFGMTGSFAVKGVEGITYRSMTPNDPEEWPPRFHKVVMSFEGGVELAFCDARRFARVRYLDDVTLTSPIADLGFDALTELPEAGAFHTALGKRRAAIKAVLLDQGFLAGIGNWVADEVLYHARVHPESLAAELDVEASARLRDSIKTVLQTAVAANAVSDKYPPDWLFHHRWDTRGSKKEAPTINGHAVAFLKVGGRTSAYLPDLQKRVTGGSASKPKRRAKSKAAAKDKDSDEEEAEEAVPPPTSSRRGGPGRGKKRGVAEEDLGGLAEEPATSVETKPKRGGKKAAKEEIAEGGMEAAGEVGGGGEEGLVANEVKETEVEKLAGRVAAASGADLPPKKNPGAEMLEEPAVNREGTETAAVPGEGDLKTEAGDETGFGGNGAQVEEAGDKNAAGGTVEGEKTGEENEAEAQKEKDVVLEAVEKVGAEPTAENPHEGGAVGDGGGSNGGVSKDGEIEGGAKRSRGQKATDGGAEDTPRRKSSRKK